MKPPILIVALIATPLAAQQVPKPGIQTAIKIGEKPNAKTIQANCSKGQDGFWLWSKPFTEKTPMLRFRCAALKK